MSDPQTDAALAELLDDLGIRHELPTRSLASTLQDAYGPGVVYEHTFTLPSNPQTALVDVPPGRVTIGGKSIRLRNGVELPVTDEILADWGWAQPDV